MWSQYVEAAPSSTFFKRIGIGFLAAVVLGIAVALFVSLGVESSPAAVEVDPAILQAQGEIASTTYGCAACHSADGSPLVGPTWLGLAGSDRTLVDGTSVVADADYLRASIIDPSSQLVDGFQDAMPKGLGDTLGAEDIDALIAYIESLGS